MLTESISVRRRLLGPDHPELSRSLSNLSRVLIEVGDLGPAAAAQEEASRIRSRLPRGALTAADTFGSGQLNLAKGKFAAAVTDLSLAVELGKEFLSPEHHETLQALSAFSVALNRTGKRAEAREVQQRVLDVARRRFGRRHALVGLAETRLAGIDLEDGRYDASLALSLHAVAVLSEMHGADHPRVADALMVEGRAHLAKKQLAQARSAFARALAIRRAKLRPFHPGIREAEGAGQALSPGLHKAGATFQQVVFERGEV